MDKFTSDIIQDYNHRTDLGFAHHMYNESSNRNTREQGITHVERLQEIPEYFNGLMSIKKLEKECNQLHKRIKQNIEDKIFDERKYFGVVAQER